MSRFNHASSQLMNKQNSIIKFGEDVEGYMVPVLNEREIRASAGIMFVMLLISWMFILFKGDFLLVKYVITVFFTDFIIRVFVSPRFSPTLIIGRMIVSKQTPEYVSAPPKKFAWKIGIGLSGLMFFLLVMLNSYSIITGISCVICLCFLFFESAFGICLGCLFYPLLYKDEAGHCAGEVCEVTNKQAIQKTARVQLLIVICTIVYVLMAILFFNDYLREAPKSLKEIIKLL
jgi:hypothetical protein